MQPDAFRLAMAAFFLVTAIVAAPEGASAGPSLYTGSIQIRMNYLSVPSTTTVVPTYSIPFGASFSYPDMNNLPSGDLATVTGSGPATLAIGSKQMTLSTSMFESSPPPSWGLSYASSHFSAENAAASFFGGGAPGSAFATSLTSVPYGRFGVAFGGTSTRFGGIMRLLGSFEASWGAGASMPYRTAMPLSPIGGSFGGTATAKAYRGGSISSPVYATETVWGFSWTTGTVWAYAPLPGGSPATATVTAVGADLRTPQGAGNLQLVSPFVVRHHDVIALDEDWVTYQAGVAVMSLHFVPEPAAGLQLAAGLAGLAALHRFSRRRARSLQRSSAPAASRSTRSSSATPRDQS